jgi:hypothetical protein
MNNGKSHEYESPTLKGTLDSEPLCLEPDNADEYLFVGCANKSIYQVKLKEAGTNYQAFHSDNTDVRIEKD